MRDYQVHITQEWLTDGQLAYLEQSIRDGIRILGGKEKRNMDPLDHCLLAVEELREIRSRRR